MGEVLPVVVALVISALAGLIVAFGLPESTPCVLGADPERVNVRKLLGQEQKECFSMHATRKLSMAEILKLPSMKLLLAVYFLVFLAFNLFYVAFPVYAATGIRWSLGAIGVYFSAMSLMMALVQGPVLKRLTKRWSEHTLVLGGSILLAASFPFFTASSTWLIYGGTALLAVGNGLMWPSLLAMLSAMTDKTAQGAVQGFASSTGAVASSDRRILERQGNSQDGCLLSSSDLRFANGECVALLRPPGVWLPLLVASSCRWCSLSWQSRQSSSQLLPSGGLLS